MKTYTEEELQVILDNHEKWLKDDSNGVHANLRNADLRNSDLRCADLSYANLRGADLIGTNLSGVNLRNADLRGADLRGANLYGANLCNADLGNAYLGNADLRNANLRNADLRNADLCGADFGGAFGNMKHVKSLQIEKYCITYTSKIIQIGCQSHTIEEWRNFDDKTISEMDRGALELWNKWKPIIMKIIEMSPCEPTEEEDENA